MLLFDFEVIYYSCLLCETLEKLCKLRLIYFLDCLIIEKRINLNVIQIIYKI